MNDISVFLTTLFAWLGPQVVAVLGLTIAQVVLAVAVALKTKNFEIQKLADFFTTIIVPKLLGWVACVVVVTLVPAEYLPKELSGGIQTVAFLTLIVSFAGSIIANLRALGILADNAVLDKLGLPAKEITKD